MEYKQSDILHGKYHNVDVWVCAYHYRDYSTANATRNVSPIKVNIKYIPPVPGSIYQWGENILMILPYNKKGDLINKKINFFDNTSYSKKSLLVFDDEKECIEEYLNLLEVAKEGLKSWIENEMLLKNRRITAIDEIKSKWIK